MPVTRSKRPLSHAPTLSLLSDDDEPSSQPPKNSASSKQGKKHHRKENRPVILGEIIEISSDDDEASTSAITRSKPNGVAMAELQERYRKLEQETANIREENKRISRENAELKSRAHLDISVLEDQITCDVCSSTLWQPFILPDCGHTFCQSDLEDWFSMTLTQFRATNPAPVYVNGWQQQPQPRYTCPKCREHVKSKPVEDFALKSLVRAIAKAAGEASPKKVPARGHAGHGQRREPGPPFSQFFPQQ